MDILAQRFQKSPTMVFREIADTFILVPIHHTVTDMEALYELDGVAAYIWSLIDGEKDGHQILQQILEKYDVTPETAQQDLFEYLEQLISVQAIVGVPA
jgi:hypothetical protein